jgi:hypothetical protein
MSRFRRPEPGHIQELTEEDAHANNYPQMVGAISI